MDGYVYLIKNEDESIYKIGISVNIKQRIKNLQTGSSSKIFLVSSYRSQLYKEIELSLHNFWKHHRISGEWYNLSLEKELDFIPFCQKIEKNLQILIKNPVGDVF